MKQNKRFKQDFIINKDYTLNQNLSKNCDKLNETNHQDFVSKKTNKLKFARGKSESTFELRAPQVKNLSKFRLSASNSSSTYGNFKQKNRTHKFAKIFAGISLATLITCGTVLGFAPLASSGMSSNSSTSSSMSATESAKNAEDLKAHVAEYKANIESGKIKYAPSALGLDPANDPVLFTTESGLEIKMSNANPTVNHNGTFDNSALNGYMYLTMGTYNGYAINWLITAFSNKPPESTTPAGALLNSLVSKHAFMTAPIAGTNRLYCDSTLAGGTFRLISECVLGATEGMTLSIYDKHTVSCPSGYFDILTSNPVWAYQGVVIGRYDKNNTLNSYIQTDALGLLSYANNRIITGIHYLSDAQANLLTTRIAYTIGTTTPATWWNSGGYTIVYGEYNSKSDRNVTFQLPYYNTSGTISKCTVGTCVHDAGDETYYKSVSDASDSAGIRPALIVKLI